MSKKNLLNETTIRQFMKYANIEGLADNFVNEMYVTEIEEEEEGSDPVPDMSPPGPEDAEELAPLPAEEDLPADDGPVAPLSPDALSALDAAVEKGVEALFAALEPLGFEGEASTVDDNELPADPPPEDMDMPMGEEGEEDEVVSGVDMLDEDEIVNETMRRVSRRLRAMKAEQARGAKREALVEDIASRIAERLKLK